MRIAAVLLGAIILAGAAALAQPSSVSVPTDAHLLLYRHEDGRIEVALEQDGERYLPSARFLSPTADAGRWLRSSAVTIAVEVPKPEPEVIEKIVEVEVEKIVEVEVEKIVEVEGEKIVEVEVEKIVEVEEPTVRYSARPSDHPGGLFCLAEEDTEGHTWTWTNDDGDTERFDTAFGVYTSGIWFGWSTGLELEGLPSERWQEMRKSAAWYAQCASYHGIDVRNEAEYATEPDDWMQLTGDE
jgi:hypothetical protein